LIGAAEWEMGTPPDPWDEGGASMTDRPALWLNLSAGVASVCVAVTLVALKAWALWTTGALTIAASLADSAIDLVASLAALASVAYAARPADDDHTFGHSAIEDLFALAQSVLVAGSAGLIAWTAIARIGDGTRLSAEGAGLAVMLLALVLTGALVLWQQRVVARTGSRVVAADRMHYLSDLLPGLAAVVALIASLVWGVAWPDTVLSLGASAFLLYGAVRIGREAFDALMDREASPETVATVRRIAASQEGIAGFHDLRTRRSGSQLFVQLHVEIDGDRTLNEAHAIGAHLRRRIREVLPQADVIVHKDPVGDGSDAR
jgi:ferrous-iron efflux pump FieF